MTTAVQKSPCAAGLADLPAIEVEESGRRLSDVGAVRVISLAVAVRETFAFLRPRTIRSPRHAQRKAALMRTQQLAIEHE